MSSCGFSRLWIPPQSCCQPPWPGELSQGFVLDCRTCIPPFSHEFTQTHGPAAALSLEVPSWTHGRARGSSSLNMKGDKGHKCAFK